jgi:apolipoprotein N-acyltransferase
MASANNAPRLGWALLAAAITASLVWLGTGLFPMWPLLWLAPIPVLLFAARSKWSAAGLTAFIAWAAGCLNEWHYFTRVLHIPIPGSVMTVVAPALIFALSVLLYRALLVRGLCWSALLGFPAAWVSFEYIFNLTSVHGTAVSLSYSQLRFLPVLQLASVTGPWGISFLLLMFSAGVSIAMHLRKSAPMQAIRVVSVTLSVTIVVVIFGAIRLATPSSNKTVEVGLVASDFGANAGAAGQGAPTEKLLRDYETQAESLAAQGAQVIVLPEHLGEIADPNTSTDDAIFQSLADKAGVTIIVGVSHVEADAKFNQARVYRPNVQVASYNKEHLLPPFESIFKPGSALTILPEPAGRWGVAICKDMDFTQLSRRYGREGAGLMLVPAWDFTLDRVLHGHMAIMRGVESGFSIARAARGGFLTVSDDRGRVRAEKQSNSAPFATLLAPVPAMHDATLYLKWGDWFARVVFVLLAFTILRLAFVKKTIR